MYNESLVKRAIHIYRHPLDNIVARFHLEFNIKKARGDTEYTALFPKNSTGFSRWCSLDNSHKEVIDSPHVDDTLRSAMKTIPCSNEFFRYVQWHNMANFVIHDMKLDSMILHYQEYSENYERARDRVLDFLGLKRVAAGETFKDGKVYRSYYSREQKLAIRAYIKELATAETWSHLKNYDFETDESPTHIE